MKCTIILVAATALLPSVMADWPKLNQYKSQDDCLKDQNILYHAAPISGRCYNFDDETVSFFWNPGTLGFPSVYTGKDCNGIKDPLSLHGRCKDKYIYNSFKLV